MTYILFNPLANGGRGDRGLEDVTDALSAEDPQVIDVTQTDAAAFLGGLTADDKAVLCGGDGTIHRLANELDGIAPAVPVYVWRYGTGNDFFRDVTIGTPEENAPSILLNDQLHDLPVVSYNGKKERFLNGCSCGVDAVVCGMMEENRFSPGKASYAATALTSFFRRYKPMSGRVTVDGETRAYDRIWMAAAMNGRFQGGGMRFAPEQDRHSGQLCCLVWHGTTPLGTLLRFPFVIPGKHTKFANCDIRFGREITVELDAPTVIQLDGEVTDGVAGYTVRK